MEIPVEFYTALCVCLLPESSCVFKSRLLKIGDGLPLILPPKSGGYWIDPPLDRHVETSPTSSSPSLGLETYDIMERDNEAKIYQEFFRHRVRTRPMFTT